MKGAELPGSPASASLPKTNGMHRAAKKNGTGAKRPDGRLAPEVAPDVAPDVLAAPFLGIAAEPVDAPMWPIHPPGWFQPEATPSAPSWSGLNIERRNRIPSADLFHFDLEPLQLSDRPDNRCEALIPAARPAVPDSGLEPLGWDPRANCPKKELK